MIRSKRVRLAKLASLRRYIILLIGKNMERRECVAIEHCVGSVCVALRLCVVSGDIGDCGGCIDMSLVGRLVFKQSLDILGKMGAWSY